MKEVLLHCCCAPCSGAIIEWMLANEVRPTLFFFNPNIFPEEEYLVRRNELQEFAERQGLRTVNGDWDHAGWRDQMRGLESEPERGARCLECFRMRLLAAARMTSALGLSEFTTTLASSRWKRLDQVSEAGNWAASQVPGVAFWDRNWRKGGLQVRRGEIIRENSFYNQLWCGCEFSMGDLEERRSRQTEEEREKQDAERIRLLSLYPQNCCGTES